MSAAHDDLSPKQHAAVLALLGHGTITKAAEATGVNEKTLRRWLAEPAFKAVYLQARRDSVDHATTLLQQLCGSAVLALGQALQSGETGEKIKAAKIVLDAAVKGVELADVAAEVEELKQQVQRITDGRKHVKA